MPHDPETKELASIEVAATSKGAVTTVIDYDDASSHRGRSIVGVEVINGHNFAIVIESGRWSERILAKQTRFVEAPHGGVPYIDVRATGGAITAETVIIKPTIEMGPNEARRRRRRRARRELGDALNLGGL